MEILCRVPIKTLTTSKSVCKSWLNLIRDPKFCHLHRARAPIEVCIQPYHYVEGNTRTLHLGNFNSPNNLPPCPFEFPESCVRNYQGHNGNGKLYFANSCNGLLCYYGGSHTNRFALVCNPFTSEFITFHPPEVHEKFSGCRGYALGFSSKANKFKLLLFMRTSGLKMQICTIEKACSWKAVGRCDITKFSKDLGAIFFQGALHWVPEGMLRSRSSILVFNLENERLGRFLFPRYPFSCGMTGRSILGVLAGRLCLTVHHTDGGVTIWLMTEYGEPDSWIKLFSLGSTVCKGLEMKYVRCITITRVGNCEILMKCIHDTSSTVIVYNPVQKTSRVIGSGPVALRVIAYNPSLVLLKDSVLGYDVHVTPNCAGLKQGQIFTIPEWWSPMEDEWRPLKELLE